MASTVSTIISDDTLNRGIQIESAGRPNARAATSSARGLGQFLNGTWIEEVRQHRPDLFNGPPFGDELALENDPSLQVEMMARFWEDNARALGAGWTEGDLYLAHFLGVATAKKFLRAPADAKAEPLAGAKAVAANRSILAGKTAGQVRVWAANAMASRWEKAGRPDYVKRYYKGKVPASALPQAPAPLPLPSATPSTKQDTKEAAGIVVGTAGVTGGWYAFWGQTSVRVAVVLAICAILAAIYWFLVRPVLRRYTALDQVEADRLTRLRLALKGVKTKLFSWLLGIAGIALPVLSMVGDVDLSAFLPDIGGVPASVYQYGLLALIGWATNALRNATTTPVGQTDLGLADPLAVPVVLPSEPGNMPMPPIAKSKGARPRRKRQRRAIKVRHRRPARRKAA